MFPLSDLYSNIPAFIAKLWEMVNDQKYDNLIQWCNDGMSFVIKDPSRFCSELLPIYYKHNNMASFIRQLNKYGFRKVVPIDGASLKNDRSDLEFTHPNFLKDYPALLARIKRKISNNKEVTYSGVVSQLAQEVQQLKQKQNIFESKICAMKNENNALWREHSLLRQKHQKLQQIINKLIQFLVTLVQQTRVNIKRINLPLMIKEKSQFPNDGIAAIKDHSYDYTARLKGSKQSNASSSGNILEEAVANASIILDDEHADNILSQISVYEEPGPSSSSSSDTQPFSSSSILKAVPIQEVSPAIVYGKYLNDSTGSTATTSNVQLNNTGKKKMLKRNLPVEVTVNKPNTVFLKPEKPSKSSTTNTKSIINEASKKKPIIKIVRTQESDTSNKSSNVVKITQAKSKGKPSIVVLNPGNSVKSVLRSNNKNVDIEDKDKVVSNEVANDEVHSLPIITSPSGTQMSPHHSETTQSENENVSNISDQSLAPLQKDIDNHIETIQSDLDVLKDLLQGEGISIDASTYLDLFNSADPLSLNMPEAGLPNDSSSLTGNELVEYNTPSLIDIVDSLDDNDVNDYSSPVPTPTLNTPKPDLLSDFTFPSPTPSKRMKK